MKTLYRLTLVLVSVLSLGSCYKDLGNYDYREINEIIIETEPYSYASGSASTFTISPKVVQTMTEGTENLSYEWKQKITEVEWKVVGNGPEYEFSISAEDDQPFNFIFAVTDNNLGIVTYAEITVNPVSAFDQCWFLLQNIGGKAVLGSVSGDRDLAGRPVTAVIAGVDLAGAPEFLGVYPYMNKGVPASPNYVPLLGVFTSDNQYILNGFTLLPDPELTYDRIVYGKKYAGQENMPPANSEGPQIMEGNKNGFAIVDGGIIWYAVPDQYALMYPVKLSPALGDTFGYDAAGVCVSHETSNTFLMYDSRGHRFLFYDSGADFGSGLNDRKEIVEAGGTSDDLYLTGTHNNQNTMVEIPDIVTNPNVFDPNSIPSDYILDDMEYSQGDRTTNVLAIGHSGSRFTVYEFNIFNISGKTHNDRPNCSAFWETDAAGDLSGYGSGKIPVATSVAFTRQFFYAAGNGIYKVDLTMASPAPALIWSSGDASDIITGLKFKSDMGDIAYDDESGNFAQKGITRHLGAVVRHADGSCDLVEFNMTTGGEIGRNDDGGPDIQTFSGFTDVVDFVFSYRDYLR